MDCVLTEKLADLPFLLFSKGEKDILIYFHSLFKGSNNYNLSEEKQRSFLPLSKVYEKTSLETNWEPKIVNDNVVVYKKSSNFNYWS